MPRPADERSWALGGEALGSLNRAQRRRICALPFTLFSLRFSDAAFWRDLIEQPTDGMRRGGGGESFCRTAVFLAGDILIWSLAVFLAFYLRFGRRGPSKLQARGRHGRMGHWRCLHQRGPGPGLGHLVHVVGPLAAHGRLADGQSAVRGARDRLPHHGGRLRRRGGGAACGEHQTRSKCEEGCAFHSSDTVASNGLLNSETPRLLLRCPT